MGEGGGVKSAQISPSDMYPFRLPLYILIIYIIKILANPEQISNRDVLPLSESPSLPHVLTLWSVASPSLFLTGSVTSLQTLSV